MSEFLELHSIRKRFGDLEVLSGISVSVREGQVLTLLGPSGSGKTTLLRVIAGFERPDAGSVRVDGEDVVELAPEKRRFGMVFQHYALFPHLSVGENVAFGLESVRVPKSRVSKSEVAARVESVLSQVDLSGFSSRRIHELSGGQQQRVALARALAPSPRLLLLDEPLSNLDPTLRERTRSELRRLVGEVGITAVWVTHEQEEAFHVGDVVAVLEGGHLQQAGEPSEIYRRPSNRFVASFVGRASWLEGRRTGEGHVAVESSDHRVSWPWVSPGLAAGESMGHAVDVLVRPEQLALQPAAGGKGLPGRIVERRFAGSTTLYRVEVLGGTLLEVADSNPSREVGSSCAVVLREGERAVVFDRGSER